MPMPTAPLMGTDLAAILISSVFLGVGSVIAKFFPEASLMAAVFLIGLAILNITKQSLSRVLSTLVKDGYIVQKTGTGDRRQRLLYLTDRGIALEARLTEMQGRRFAAAYRNAGAKAVEGFQHVLQGLLDAETRSQIDRQDKSE